MSLLVFLILYIEVPEVNALSVAEERSYSTVDILLVGAGDCRHILKTICQAWKRPNRKYTVSLHHYEVSDFSGDFHKFLM